MATHPHFFATICAVGQGRGGNSPELSNTCVCKQALKGKVCLFEGVRVLEGYQYVFAFKTRIISMHTPFYIGFIFDAAQENGWLLIEVELK